MGGQNRRGLENNGNKRRGTYNSRKRNYGKACGDNGPKWSRISLRNETTNFRV